VPLAAWNRPRRWSGGGQPGCDGCPAFEEQRRYFRAVTKSGERVASAARRRPFRERWVTIMTELAAA